MAKICNKCGAEIAPDAAFCTNCGAKAPEAEAVVQPQAKEAPLQEEQTPKAEVCLKCGSTLNPDAAFCTSCGTPRGTAPDVQREPQPQPQPQPQVQFVQEAPRQQYAQPAPQYTAPQPQYTQPVAAPQPPSPQAPASVKPEKEDKTNKVVGTGTYFWMMFLYALPIIGFLVCLIMSFAAKNKNLRNFARAIMIWVLVGLIISALTAGVIYILVGSLGDLLGGSFGTLFYSFDVGNLAGQITRGLGNIPL